MNSFGYVTLTALLLTGSASAEDMNPKEVSALGLDVGMARVYHGSESRAVSLGTYLAIRIHPVIDAGIALKALWFGQGGDQEANQDVTTFSGGIRLRPDSLVRARVNSGIAFSNTVSYRNWLSSESVDVALMLEGGFSIWVIDGIRASIGAELACQLYYYNDSGYDMSYDIAIVIEQRFYQSRKRLGR